MLCWCPAMLGVASMADAHAQPSDLRPLSDRPFSVLSRSLGTADLIPPPAETTIGPFPSNHNLPFFILSAKARVSVIFSLALPAYGGRSLQERGSRQGGWPSSALLSLDSPPGKSL